MLVLVNATRLTTKIVSLFLSVHETIDLSSGLVVCGIPDMQNTAGNRPEQLFMNPKGFTGIDDFIMLRIKDVTNIIKYHNLVPNKE